MKVPWKFVKYWNILTNLSKNAVSLTEPTTQLMNSLKKKTTAQKHYMCKLKGTTDGLKMCRILIHPRSIFGEFWKSFTIQKLNKNIKFILFASWVYTCCKYLIFTFLIIIIHSQSLFLELSFIQKLAQLGQMVLNISRFSREHLWVWDIGLKISTFTLLQHKCFWH